VSTNLSLSTASCASLRKILLEFLQTPSAPAIPKLWAGVHQCSIRACATAYCDRCCHIVLSLYFRLSVSLPHLCTLRKPSNRMRRMSFDRDTWVIPTRKNRFRDRNTPTRSRFALRVAAKPLHTAAKWFIMTAYKNSETAYLMAPSLTPCMRRSLVPK